MARPPLVSTPVTSAISIHAGLFVQVAWRAGLVLGLGTGARSSPRWRCRPMVARDENEASEFAALVFFLGYFLAFTGPLVAGTIADASGSIAAPSGRRAQARS